MLWPTGHRGLFLLIFNILSVLSTRGQDATTLLQAGPMLGPPALREAKVWVQTKAAVPVLVEYWDVATPDQTYLTPEMTPDAAHAYAITLTLAPLEPGRRYAYRVLLDGEALELPYPTELSTPPLWQYRTDPPTVRIALGSCNYVNDSAYDRPGPAYGRAYGIYDAIVQQKPDLMLWLGDNTYLREGDFDSRTGIMYRYTHTRSHRPMQPLLASTAHLATWDDHDYGPNDADGSYILKQHALDAFRLFWPNPTCGLPNVPGVFTSYVLGDVQFFLLDNRWYRTAPGLSYEPAQMLGQAQLSWLINALKASKAPLKLIAVGGQVLNPAPVFENMARYFGPERNSLLQAIRNENIEGVMLLSGDRHHSELSVLQPNSTPVVHYPLYEFTVSPLTAAPSTIDLSAEPNTLRMADTAVRDNAFGLLEITGPQGNRVLALSLHNAAGAILWKKTVNLNDLKIKK